MRKIILLSMAFILIFAAVTMAQTWQCKLTWPLATDPQNDLYGYKIYRLTSPEPPIVGVTPHNVLIKQGDGIPPVDNLTFDLGPGYFYFWISAIDALKNETLLNGAASIQLGVGPEFAPVWPENAELKIELIIPDPFTRGQ